VRAGLAEMPRSAAVGSSLRDRSLTMAAVEEVVCWGLKEGENSTRGERLRQSSGNVSWSIDAALALIQAVAGREIEGCGTSDAAMTLRGKSHSELAGQAASTAPAPPQLVLLAPLREATGSPPAA
jgi:hypothetical protein